MNGLVDEWVAKAEADGITALREYRARRSPNYDAACLGCYPLWQAMQNDMELLTQYAIHFRYPGESADKSEAKQAIDAMQRCRKEILVVL